MATWKELSRDNLDAAKALLEQGYWRASINRSYYAAYCAVSERATRNGVQFARGWNNPSHDQLLALIQNGLTLAPQARRRTAAALRRLRLAREAADYKPRTVIGRATAIVCIHDAATLLEVMED